MAMIRQSKLTHALVVVRQLITIACIFAAASTNAADKTNPSYITAKEITAMTPCTGKLAKRLSEFSCSFTTVDGSGFVLGDATGEQWVWHFLATLKEGQTCKFPDAFVNYMSAPSYGTAKEIAAMAPRTGTLASRSPCSSYFTTADGKGFGIGNPGSGAEISQFIWTLKPGQSYKFPDALLEYQAAPKYGTAKEITEMVRCTATLVTRWDGSGYFQTADGKGFLIGGGHGGADIDKFLGTLTEEQTYKFPDTFLDYQKQNPSKKP